MGLRTANGEARRKGLAWLLGYASHVVADVAIHPVINLKVGPYEKNKTDHRICEMHQDVYVYRRLNLGDIGLSEHLAGIWACHDPNDEERLDRDIENLWHAMLQATHPEECAQNPPDPSYWRRRFQLVVDKVAEEGGKLLPFARHVAAGLGLTYPAQDELDNQFIRGLQTPTVTMDYDAVFDLAIEHVGRVWQWIAQAVLLGDEATLAEAGEWDLDTGQNEASRLVFWG